MERQSTCSNSSYSGLSIRDSSNNARVKTYPVNTVAKTNRTHPSELRNLNSSILSLMQVYSTNSFLLMGLNNSLIVFAIIGIVCSANISRQSLNQQPKTSVASDNEDEFFQKLKSEIDRDLLS